MKYLEQQEIVNSSEAEEGLNEETLLQFLGSKLVVMDRQECTFLNINHIAYVEADGPYSTIFLANGTKMVVCKNVKVFTERLNELSFWRIHKSYLVNIRYISKYIRGDGGRVILENGANLPVSIKKKNSIMQLIEAMAL